METDYVRKKLEQIKREGYGLHLEGVLSNAFDIHKKVIIPGLVATLLYVFAMLLTSLTMFETLYGMSLMEFMETIQRNPNAIESTMANIPLSSMVIYSVVFSVVTGLIAPLLSGIYKVAYDTQYGGNASVSDLFSYYRQPYFLNIFIYSFLFAAVLQFTGLFLAQEMPGLGSIVAFLIQVVLSVSFIFTIPFIIFGKFSWVEALKSSISVTSKNWFFLFFILAISAIISFLGVIFCVIGILFTYPFIYISTFVLYDKIIGFSNDEIVNSEIIDQ